MNPRTIAEAKKNFSTFLKQKYQNKNVTTVICPPDLYFSEIRQMYAGSKMYFGAQNCFSKDEGAYTGEVSVQMLQSMKCRFVIVGHSERRAMGETDSVIAQKVQFALKSGMHVVLCVGELERKEDGSHLKFIEDQLRDSLVGVSKNLVKNLIVAYEPVWAIGAGAVAMDSHSIHQMSLFIRKNLLGMFGKKVASEISVIYGGSSNAENAASIVIEGEVDGLLPGRASLNPIEFAKMIDAVSKAI